MLEIRYKLCTYLPSTSNGQYHTQNKKEDVPWFLLMHRLSATTHVRRAAPISYERDSKIYGSQKKSLVLYLCYNLYEVYYSKSSYLHCTLPSALNSIKQFHPVTERVNLEAN